MAEDSNRDLRKAEPEIIPPGRGDALRGPDRSWTQFEEAYGSQGVYIVRPGLTATILGLLVLGVAVALIFLVLAGVILLWLPILIGGVLLALLSGLIRYRWHNLQAWLANRR
jgi:Flp pilus assembly protein TadB